MAAVGQPVWASETFPVDLTREQVENSPDVDLAKPVSRQYEEKLHRHYRWAEYWSMTTAIPGYPAYIPPQIFAEWEKAAKKEKVDSHLRSTKELFGYQVNAEDGEVGSITDFITQDAIKFSPLFDPTLPVNRQNEEVIYDYYGRSKYWQVVE